MWAIAWLSASATAAAVSAERLAMRHRDRAPGRDTNQRPMVAAASTGTLHSEKSSTPSAMRLCPRRSELRRWKMCQSIGQA
jgi:hypothetical protein